MGSSIKLKSGLNKKGVIQQQFFSVKCIYSSLVTIRKSQLFKSDNNKHSISPSIC